MKRSFTHLILQVSSGWKESYVFLFPTACSTWDSVSRQFESANSNHHKFNVDNSKQV